MDDQERSLLALLAVLLAAKVLQQVVLLLRPVRVGGLEKAVDAVSSARDAADFALYAKGGKRPGWSRLRLALCLSAAVVACVPPWWRLTSVRVCALLC
jgi:hypothetical protein